MCKKKENESETSVSIGTQCSFYCTQWQVKKKIRNSENEYAKYFETPEF